LSPCVMTNARAARGSPANTNTRQLCMFRGSHPARMAGRHETRGLAFDLPENSSTIVRERKHAIGVSSRIVSFPGSRSDTFFRRLRAASPNAARFFSRPTTRPRNPSSFMTLTDMQSRMSGAHQRRLSWGLDEAHYCGYLECRCQLSSSWLCSGIIEQAPNAAPAGQRRAAGCHSANNEGDMGKSILLWRLGVPIPTIVLLLLLG